MDAMWASAHPLHARETVMAQSLAEIEARVPDDQDPYSDEPQMESPAHWHQLALLVNCLEWHWQDREDYFIGANLSVYYDRERLREPGLCGPDLFVVRGVAQRQRRSWVVWKEGGRFPDVIVELLSKETARVDRGRKKRLYQDVFRTPEYFWFSPVSLEFAGFRLGAEGYRAIQPDATGWRYSEQLGLYLGVQGEELRFFTSGGELLPSSAEAAQAEHARAELEHARAQRLAERLRAAGLDPASDG
jgi:Uma2 family endonuclease